LYGRPFGPPAIIQLLKDTWSSHGRAVSHVLYSLAKDMPLADTPAVLDGIEPVRRQQNGDHRSMWDVAAFYEVILTRAWESESAFDAGRALRWLEVRRSMQGMYSGDRGERLRLAMRSRPERLRALADRFLEDLAADDHSWLRFTRFRETTFFEIRPDELLDDVIRHLKAADRGSAKQRFLYEAALSLSHQASEAHGRAAFEELYDMAETRPDLAEVRLRGTLCVLPSGYFPRMTSSGEPDEKTDKERLRQEFAADAADIRAGRNLGHLGWAAIVYFALFDDVDGDATPRQRLVAYLGEENTEAVLAGFKAVLARQDLPSFNEVLGLAAEHKRGGWWFAILAGLNEKWASEPGFGDISDDLLKAMLAFELTNPIPEAGNGKSGWLTHPWKEPLFRQRPDLAREAYTAIARVKMEAGENYIAGLHELLHDLALEPFRTQVALEFLRDYSNAQVYRLRELLDAATKDPAARADLQALARNVLGGGSLDDTQRDIWLAVAFVLSPAEFRNAVETRAKSRPGLIFELRTWSGFSRDAEGARAALLLPELEFLAQLTGSHFPLAGYPPNGWSGDTNPWDASDYFRALADAISANPSAAATAALERLAQDPALASYRPDILHDLAGQRQRRRDAEYDRPDWSKTVSALANGAPATVADLHALLVAELRDEANRIARTNTDIYKAFWNIDRHARPTSPRPEEACRDTLVDRLRTRLAPHGISVEPEGHMAGDKRADISVAMPGRKILCELKRDYHAEVWTAAEQQLDRFYAHDPEAGGFGVYLVFWFAKKRPSPITAPPGGRPRPSSAAEMEMMVRDILPADFASRIAVLVIDVAGPPALDPKRKISVGKKKTKNQIASTKKKTARRTPGGARRKGRKSGKKKARAKSAPKRTRRSK
jgi:hypothetical protein